MAAGFAQGFEDEAGRVMRGRALVGIAQARHGGIVEDLHRITLDFLELDFGALAALLLRLVLRACTSLSRKEAIRASRSYMRRISTRASSQRPAISWFCARRVLSRTFS